jgi:DNA-binding Xre family transcriptional regulator
MEKYIICDLYRLMQRKGIRSVSELQRTTGLSRRTLDKSFHNDSKQINHDTALALCKVLECDFSELYRMVDKNEYEQTMEVLRKQQEYLNKGFVYFVRHIDFGFTKIGKTSDLKVRMQQLKLEFGNVKLLHFIETDNAIELEKQFHTLFANKRSEREWFNLTDEDIRKLMDKQTLRNEVSE